jgi:hypothetical protein
MDPIAAPDPVPELDATINQHFRDRQRTTNQHATRHQLVGNEPVGKLSTGIAEPVEVERQGLRRAVLAEHRARFQDLGMPGKSVIDIEHASSCLRRSRESCDAATAAAPR